MDHLKKHRYIFWLGTYFGVELLGQRIWISSSWVNIPKQISRVVVIPTPASTKWSSSCFTSHQIHMPPPLPLYHSGGCVAAGSFWGPCEHCCFLVYLSVQSTEPNDGFWLGFQIIFRPNSTDGSVSRGIVETKPKVYLESGSLILRERNTMALW